MSAPQARGAAGWLAVALLRLRARACLALGWPGPARQAFEAILRRTPDDTHALASRAHLAAAGGDAAAALADLHHCLRVDAGNAPAWFNLAFLLEARGASGEAEAAFRRALALQPGLDRAWFGLGLALMRQSRWAEAEAAFAHATRLQPMSPHGWEQRAHALAAQGRAAEAAAIVHHLGGFEPQAARRLHVDLAARWLHGDGAAPATASRFELPGEALPCR